jgi:hypothetical protein
MEEALLNFKTKSFEELRPYINEEGFMWACENELMEVAQWIMSFIVANDINAFINLCSAGELQLAQEFYSINPNIDISVDNERIFKIVCENGHLEMAKWLFSVKPTINISADDNYAIKYALKNEHMNVVSWLNLLIKKNN